MAEKADGAAPPEADDGAKCGWVKLYARCGALVTLPIYEKKMDYAAMLANVEAAVEAGFSVYVPGLTAGEHKVSVGWMVRGTQEQRGELTPFILLYEANPAMKFSFLKVYLNNDEEIAAFEAASGVKLNTMTNYVGRDKPERGQSRITDEFFVQVKKPFQVVYADNPDYSADERAKVQAAGGGGIYKVPQHKFVRWVGRDDGAAPVPQKLSDVKKPAEVDTATKPPAGKLMASVADFEAALAEIMFAKTEVARQAACDLFNARNKKMPFTVEQCVKAKEASEAKKREFAAQGEGQYDAIPY